MFAGMIAGGKGLAQIGYYTAKGALTGRYGRTAQGAAMGYLGGAGWGMTSDNTSISGGALMGAALGAAGGRYGSAGLRRAGRGGSGLGFRAHAGRAARGFGRGVRAQVRADYKGVRMMANRGLARIGSSLKGRAMPHPIELGIMGATAGALGAISYSTFS